MDRAFRSLVPAAVGHSALKLRRITVVWLGLLAATAISWEFGHGFGLRDPRNAGVMILVITFTKIRFVIQDFMELRHAPLGMRVAGEAWAFCIGGVLIALYRI